jgi:hypothetical protein
LENDKTVGEYNTGARIISTNALATGYIKGKTWLGHYKESEGLTRLYRDMRVVKLADKQVDIF